MFHENLNTLRKEKGFSQEQFIAAIYELWSEMWHEFGQNLYHMMND